MVLWLPHRDRLAPDALLCWLWVCRLRQVGVKWEASTRFGKGVMASADRRFRQQQSSDPGPGAYDNPIHSINVKARCRRCRVLA